MDIYGQIYKLTNTINGKIYVGQTTSTEPRRWSSHKHHAKYGGHGPLQNAIRKYGPDVFKREIIDKAYSEEELNSLEEFYIKTLDARNHDIGYNVASGPSRSGQSKKKLSDILSGEGSGTYRHDLKDEEIKHLYESGLNVSEISRKLEKTCPETIRKRLKKQGIFIRPHKANVSEKEVCEKYLLGSSKNYLSKEYGISVSAITRILRDGKIEERPLSEVLSSLGKNSPHYKEISTESMRIDFLSGLTIKEISEKYGVHRDTVWRRFKKEFPVSINNTENS